MENDRYPSMNEADTYVVTLRFDAPTFEWLQALRTLHFPPSRNFVPAHLTLLHTVSLEQVERLKQGWSRFDQWVAFTIRFTAVKSLGCGTALVVESPILTAFRTKVMQTMGQSFSQQDQQPFKAHVTVQNKVQSATARSSFEQISATFVVREGIGQGLMIWRYLGGPWSLDSILTL